MQPKKICPLFFILIFCVLSCQNFNISSAPLKHIITGPPGAGKTTLLLGLEIYHGFDIIREAATDIIALELAQGITAPWQDSDFDAKILALQAKRLTQTNTAPVHMLCDRSPIDIYAYAEFNNTVLPPAIDRYVKHIVEDPTISKTILFIENLGAVHKTAIRHETVEEAQKIETLLYKYYTLFGFRIVRVPALPLVQRMEFILEQLTKTSS